MPRCKNHNLILRTNDYLKEPYCPQCNSERLQQINRLEAKNQQELDELELKKRKFARFEKHFAGCHIASRFKHMGWSDYDTSVSAEAPQVMAVCREYAENFDRHFAVGTCLVMVGNHGTGKTTLASIVSQELIAKRMLPLHMTARKIIQKIQDIWIKREMTSSEVYASFVEPDLLVIDEVDQLEGKSSEINSLADIINDRYEARKPTILIANINFRELMARLGGRIADRFQENTKFLVFSWDSYRKRVQV